MHLPFLAYPVCSQSEEQLLKMADVYLSCMKAPNPAGTPLFDREAIAAMSCATARARLRWQGTVYSEDFGMLNDTDNEALRECFAGAVSGETAANANGQAHRF